MSEETFSKRDRAEGLAGHGADPFRTVDVATTVGITRHDGAAVSPTGWRSVDGELSGACPRERHEHPGGRARCRPIRAESGPAAVWTYKLGGYQILKKWLSYREREILGRMLTPEDVQHLTDTARRTGAIVMAPVESSA